MRTIRIITALALCALFCAPIYAQKYTVRNSGNYEVVTLGVGADGTKIFKIYVTEKTERKAIPLAKKAAIEVCVFRGLPATSTVSATPALCSLSDEQKHAAFFEEFFAPGLKVCQCYFLREPVQGESKGRVQIRPGGAGIVQQSPQRPSGCRCNKIPQLRLLETSTNMQSTRI